ncbi:MAG: hypothetical protein IT381_00110 [Deltaproteobacteria bacterium]|nr:hypothetical protein [Deltaproteobacteria bacterium]
MISFRSWIQALLTAATLVAWSGSASAHQREFGISIQPAFAGFPAVADPNSQPGLALTAGGGIGLEFYPLKYMAIVSRLAYTHALTTTTIGQATFNNEAGFPRTGDYYFKQSTAFASLGLRLETPSWWLPVQFHIGVGGGFALSIQTERKLLADGQDLRIPLNDIVKVAPIIPVTTGLFVRVASQVRFDLDGTLFVFPQNPVLVGFGITLALTFLFYT